MKTIKITKGDKFIWKIVTPNQARLIFKEQLFDLYELHDDDSETHIYSEKKLNDVLISKGEIGIEVGIINKKTL